MGDKPIATKKIEEMFLPFMFNNHKHHAEILYAIYLGGGAPERAKYDLEYAVNCDDDIEYWRKEIDWWMEKLNIKVEIINM